jgi:ribonuclease VapC
VILDTSAIVAIALDEPERDRFLEALASATAVRMSAGTWVELQAVNTRKSGNTLDKPLATIFGRYAIEIVPVSVAHAELARAAYRRYGIGTKHPARLNFGDCFAYALSKASGEPLLFKGDDFAQTDVVPAA